VLAFEELVLIWRAIEAFPDQRSAASRDLLLFLMAVPARRAEAAAMRWRDVDLSRRVWRQPTSKNDEPHDYPLSERAMKILARRWDAAKRASEAASQNAEREQRADADMDALVFPGPFASQPFCGWSHAKAAIEVRLKKPVSDWRFHDFRRTAVTRLGEAERHDEAVLDLLINHKASVSRGGVLGVYQRASRWAERVRALDDWDRMLALALGETSEDTVLCSPPARRDRYDR
jgi:integrase